MNLSETILSETVLSCALCGLKSNQLASHITKYHKLSLLEYKSSFPNAKISQLSLAQIEKMRQTKLGKETNNKQNKKAQAARANEIKSAGLDSLICGLCAFQSQTSLISHITRKHKINMSEYRVSFPDMKVQRAAPSQRKKASENMKNTLKDEEILQKFLAWRSFPSELKHWTNKGLSEEDAKLAVANFQSEQSKKGNNEKTRKLRSKKTSGDKNPMSISSIAARKNVSFKLARELTPCFGRTGRQHPMFGKRHSEESLRKISNAPHLLMPNFRSKGEVELAAFCRTLTNDTTNNVSIKRWNVDVLFHTQKLIVEFFGDYWHMNPTKYSKERVHNLMNKTAEFLWARDNRKIKELESLGYEVVVVWESDWNNEKEQQLKRIKDAFNRV